METSTDVVVVGTGPAGCMAAATLAKEGAQVALVEKEALPRYKTCGGGVVRRAALLAGLPGSSIVERACRKAKLHASATGFAFQLQREEPFLFMTMRSSLDAFLVQRAREEGARLYEQERFLAAKLSGDGLEIKTNHRCFHSRFLVGADGVHSAVAKGMGWSSRTRCIPALECEIEVPEKDYERLAVPRFDFDVLPHGYGWSFPKRRHLSVGVLSLLPDRISLRLRLQEYLGFLQLHEIQNIERHGSLIPISPRSVAAQSCTLLVGDALGLADPVTCEGISYALISGRLAASAILTGKSPAEVERTYDLLLREKIFPDLKWGTRLSKLLYGRPLLRRTLFRFCGDLLCEAVGRVICGESSYSSLLGNLAGYRKLLGRLGAATGVSQ